MPTEWRWLPVCPNNVMWCAMNAITEDSIKMVHNYVGFAVVNTDGLPTSGLQS